MAGTIYIRLLPEATEQATAPIGWLVQAQDMPITVGWGTLEQAASQAQGRRVVVLVPGTEVLLTHVQVPTKQRQRMLRAIPYALEEHLAADVDTLHFAVGARNDQGVATAVVDRARMDEWLNMLKQVEIQPHSMLTDIQALPMAEGEWVLLLEDVSTLLRTKDNDGSAVSTDTLAMMLPLALEQSGEDRPNRLQVIDCCSEASSGLETIEKFCVENEIEFQLKPGEGQLLDILVRGVKETPAIDLLQGDYSRREQLGKVWRPWLLSGALAGVWLLLLLSISLHSFFALKGEEKELTARIEKLYRDTFPDARKVVNARVQMEQRLDALKGGSGEGGVVNLLAKVGPALSQTKKLELKAMRFKLGTLELDLELGDLQTLDQLKQTLSAGGGLNVKIDTASSRDGKVETRLKIESTGAGV